MKKINFSKNYDDKLSRGIFTTIRLHNSDKYQQYENYEISLDYNKIFDAEIVFIEQCTINDLRENIARFDTGLSLEDTKKLLKEIYYYDIDWNSQLLDICYLLKK